MKKTLIPLENELHARLKIAAIQRGMKLNEFSSLIVEAALGLLDTGKLKIKKEEAK